MMHLRILFVVLLVQASAKGQSPAAEPTATEISEAYESGDFASAVQLYNTAVRLERTTSRGALLAAAGAYHLGKKSDAKKMIDRAFLTDPIAAVDSYDEERFFDELRTTKFNTWFEARLLKEVRVPKQVSAGKYVSVYSSRSQRFITTDINYRSYIESAVRLMEHGNHRTAHSMYMRAFRINDRSLLSLTRAAACAFAAGKTDWADAHINAAFSRYPHAVITRLRLNDEFAPLLEDDRFARWVGKHITRQFPNLDQVLIAEIDDIWEDFTLHRAESSGGRSLLAEGAMLTANTGRVQQSYFIPVRGGDAEMRTETDRLCVRRITNIFENRGFPGVDRIGDRFLQLEALLRLGNMEDWEYWNPLLRTAVKEGKLSGYGYARAYDEALARAGREQLFGTCLYSSEHNGRKNLFEYWPIRNLKDVEERRMKYGLYSLQQSRKTSDVAWPPAEKVTPDHLSRWKDRWPMQFIVFAQSRE